VGQVLLGGNGKDAIFLFQYLSYNQQQRRKIRTKRKIDGQERPVHSV